MRHVMFDIDGTLVESCETDSRCFVEAVKSVTGVSLTLDWSQYRHVTDQGILNDVLELNGFTDPEVVVGRVKSLFLHKLEQSLAREPVRQVPGAAAFVSLLCSMRGVSVSFATGAWRESAVLKLQSARIEWSGIPLASSDDHMARDAIMHHAARQAGVDGPCTYFGDAPWDRTACERLGYRFVLVGDKFHHNPRIANFLPVEAALACID